MSDIVQEYLNEHRLTTKKVLESIDDYSIYSHYIGVELEIYTKYSSPLREGDDDPSFVLFMSKYKDDLIMFKDMASGEYGNVFKFLMLLFDASLYDVLSMVNKDFGLGIAGAKPSTVLAKKVFKLKVVKHPTKMWVTTQESSAEFLDFWSKLDIGVPIQKMYRARDTVLIHYDTADYNAKVVPKSLCISYEINGHYKTYQPLGERRYKFRNDFPNGYVEGALQLKYEKDFAIITKSTKECMWFRQHFDFDGVAGTSETVMISEQFMLVHLKAKYKRVYIMLDNDEAGIKAQKKYTDLYPWLISVVLPKGNTKDITDRYYEYKVNSRKQEVLDYVTKTIV